ncbi:MAG: hypothetical protein JWR69_928 [Pedosphaera sp.]|nr:hypothetical protein [Pedosphaera sp.]
MILELAAKIEEALALAEKLKGQSLLLRMVWDALRMAGRYLAEHRTETAVTVPGGAVEARLKAATPTVQQITNGRIVNYVTRAGKIRPAICVEDWGATDDRVNLFVFRDGSNDGELDCGWMPSARFSALHDKNTWHWPTRS